MAYGLWVAVATLLAAGWATGNPHLGQLGLATSAGAATASIRTYFVRSNRLMRLLLAGEERRDAAQRTPDRADVRHLR